MNTNRKWSKVKGRFHYLSMLHEGDKVLGFIFQQGPESQFNCNLGCGDSFQFLGHKRNSILAKETVEIAVQNMEGSPKPNFPAPKPITYETILEIRNH